MRLPNLDKFEVIGHRLLAQRSKREANIGGVQEIWEVVALGTGLKETDHSRKSIIWPVCLGDKILVERYGSQGLIVDNEEFFIVDVSDIIARWREHE